MLHACMPLVGSTCGEDAGLPLSEHTVQMRQVRVEEQLTPVERLTMAPFWSTFCGTSNGAWQGTQAAFSPVTGAPHEGRHPCLEPCSAPSSHLSLWTDGLRCHGPR
jgi:hypothetical protein